MDGSTLVRKLREILNETSSGGFLNDRTSYDYLFSAVQDFNFRTHYLSNTQVITVQPGVSEYNLNPDFISLALLDTFTNRPYIKWTYGGTDSFIFGQDYTNIILENSTQTSTVATGFAITDSAQPDNIDGTITDTALSVNGVASLLDTTRDLSKISVGDYAHNTTADTHGIVLDVSASVSKICAMFTDGMAGAGWTQGDHYTVVPQPKYKIVFTPIPSDTATVTITYLQRPTPVYSPYQAYKLPFQFDEPIVQYAAFKYKYRDREPNFGDAYFKYYDAFTRKIAAEMRRATGERQGIRVSFSKSNARSRSFGNYSR